MHHAQLILGGTDSYLVSIPEEDRMPGSDVQVFQYETFGILESRQLQQTAYLSPVEREHRAFIVRFESITLEAQNALLKLFEEPPEAARFYISAPRKDLFIPTLLSRFYIHDEEKDTGLGADTQLFIEGSYKERLDSIAKKMKEKDIGWGDEILRGVEVYAAEKELKEVLRAVVLIRRYFNTKGGVTKDAS